MNRNMICFAAFDGILRIIFRGMVRIAFVIKIFGMYCCNSAGYSSCFRVPAYQLKNRLEL